MALDLTTLERVKLLLGRATDNTRDDDILEQLISSVSARVETYLDRKTASGSYTDYFDIQFPGQKRFYLNAWPVSAITSVHHDPDGEWAATDEVESSNYRYNIDRGELYLRIFLPRAFQGLRVIYTGGMADDAAAFIASYPEISDAVDKQVVYEYQRRTELGASTLSGKGGTVTQFPIKEFLPITKAVLDKFKRIVVG